MGPGVICHREEVGTFQCSNVQKLLTWSKCFHISPGWIKKAKTKKYISAICLCFVNWRHNKAFAFCSVNSIWSSCLKKMFKGHQGHKNFCFSANYIWKKGWRQTHFEEGKNAGKWWTKCANLHRKVVIIRIVKGYIDLFGCWNTFLIVGGGR